MTIGRQPPEPGSAAGDAERALLQAPGVHFAPDFSTRLERLVLRLSAARERREGVGRAFASGGGQEFVAYRPYRPGEDLRQLDWNLFARLDRPYVRVTRREASQAWSIVLDTSASMGVGPPGKLQRAAELAMGLAAIGLREGAQVEVCSTGDGGGGDRGDGSRGSRRGALGGGTSAGRRLVVRGARDLHALRRRLEALEAGGRSGLAAFLASGRPNEEAGRVLVIGDLCDVEPRAILALHRRGRELFLAQLLAPLELAPPSRGSVEWVDPESGERVRVALDPARRARYERALERRLEAWSELAARHRMRHGLFSSAQPFEDILRALLENAG